MEKGIRIGAGRLAALLLAMAVPSQAAQVFTLWDYQKPSPKDDPDYQQFTIWCYDVTNPNHLVDCAYTFLFDYDPPDQNNVAWNGGHAHTAGRGTAPKAIGTVTKCVPSTTLSALGCSGSTLGIVAYLDHTVPEASGIITAKGSLTFPPGWHCVPLSMCDDATHRTMLYEVYTSVAVPGLVELPSNPGLYVRCGDTSSCGGADDVLAAHPQAFFGTPGMLSAVESLASRYRGAHPTDRLRLTDMSLPLGGLFDLDLNWQPGTDGHKDHRYGTALDVAKSAIDDSGAEIGVNPAELKKLACESGLKRYEAEFQLNGNLHFDLRPCPQYLPPNP